MANPELVFQIESNVLKIHSGFFLSLRFQTKTLQIDNLNEIAN